MCGAALNKRSETSTVGVGLNIVWVDQSPCGGEDRPSCGLAGADLMVFVSSRSAVSRMGVPADVMGFAPRTDARTAGRAVYLVLDSLSQLARTHDIDVATLCAHLVAHEMAMCSSRTNRIPSLASCAVSGTCNSCVPPNGTDCRSHRMRQR